MNFKSQEEMMRALLDGEKIISNRKSWYTHMVEGFAVDPDGNRHTPQLSSFSNFSIYKEPKKTDTIEVYGFVDIIHGQVTTNFDETAYEHSACFKRAPELDRTITYEV